jgi:methyl-accepting chemotaxis protein
MAEFEELKLTVSLADNASAGLAAIRNQITQLTQSAGQVSGAFDKIASSVQQVGNVAQQATPKVTSQEKALKELAHTAEETGRGLVGMGLAAARGMEGWKELALSYREARRASRA